MHKSNCGVSHLKHNQTLLRKWPKSPRRTKRKFPSRERNTIEKIGVLQLFRVTEHETKKLQTTKQNTFPEDGKQSLTKVPAN